MMEIPGYDIRFTEEGDLSHLNDWFSFPDACDDFPFSLDEKDESLKNWIGFAKYKASLTGLMNGVPCAIGTLFLMPYRKVAHHCSFYIMVDPAHRRKGIASSMIKNLLHLAKTRFRLESIHVEIYQPSALLSVVEKLNFKTFARQDNFMKIGDCSRPRILLEHFF